MNVFKEIHKANFRSETGGGEMLLEDQRQKTTSDNK